MPPKDADGMANSVYPNQDALLEQSYLGHLCLLGPICAKFRKISKLYPAFAYARKKCRSECADTVGKN